MYRLYSHIHFVKSGYFVSQTDTPILHTKNIKKIPFIAFLCRQSNLPMSYKTNVSSRQTPVPETRGIAEITSEFSVTILIDLACFLHINYSLYTCMSHDMRQAMYLHGFWYSSGDHFSSGEPLADCEDCHNFR